MFYLMFYFTCDRSFTVAGRPPAPENQSINQRFLLVTNSNLGPTGHRFGDTVA